MEKPKEHEFLGGKKKKKRTTCPHANDNVEQITSNESHSSLKCKWVWPRKKPDDNTEIENAIAAFNYIALK